MSLPPGTSGSRRWHTAKIKITERERAAVERWLAWKEPGEQGTYARLLIDDEALSNSVLQQVLSSIK